MATIKVACPECGQRVSGDETFYGKTVDCPICQAVIRFPKGEVDQVHPADRGREKSSAKTKTPPEPKGDQKKKRTRVTKAQAKEKPERAGESKRTGARAPGLHRAAAPVMAVTPSAAAPTSGLPGTPKRTSSAAIWSLICGITALVLFPVGVLFAIPAIVCGHSGRGIIDRSLGKLGGHGLATGGLMLGYIYVILLFFVVVAEPWRPFATFYVQVQNARNAEGIVGALNNYAEDNNGKLPPKLEDLVPDFLEPEELKASDWIDPYALPMIHSSQFVYYPGHARDDAPSTILLSAPKSDPADRRLVGRLSGAVENIADEDFFREID